MPDEPLRFQGDDDQFAGLVLRYLDGVTTAEEHETLTAELKAADRPQRRDLFVALCRQRGILAEALGAQGVIESLQDRTGAPPSRRRRSARFPRTGPRASGRAYGIAAAVAAGFLVVLILWSIGPNTRKRPQVTPRPEPQARVEPAPEIRPEPIVKPKPAPIRPTSLPRQTPPAPPKLPAPRISPEAPPAPKKPAPPPPKPDPTPKLLPAPRPTTTSVTVARAERVTGDVHVLAGTSATPLKTGVQITAGQGIRTLGVQATASLVYPDKSRMELGGDTTVLHLETARGKSALLSSGVITVKASKQPEGRPMILSTPHAEVRVLGTEFTLRVTPSSTRLDVAEGRVRLTRKSDGASVEVESGHFTVAGPSAPLAVSARPGSKPPILLVAGTLALSPGDRAVKARLEKLGHSVVVKDDAGFAASDAVGMALVILSSTSGSTTIGRSFRSLAVPVMTWEAWLYDDLGMTGPSRLKDYGNLPGDQSEIVILSPTHPMAAGRSRKVAVSSPHLLMWGRPNANALVIAVLAKDVNKAALFGYERGARMPGGLAAPARRVGFFLPDNTPDVLTDDGWALFDAAVTWGASRRTR